MSEEEMFDINVMVDELEILTDMWSEEDLPDYIEDLEEN